MRNPDRAILRKMLEDRLSYSELENIAFDHDVDFSRSTKSELIKYLIEHFERRGTFNLLINWIKFNRPDISIEFVVFELDTEQLGEIYQIKATSAPSSMPESVQQKPAERQKRVIAWIDDDTDVLDPLMNPLRKLGFTIQEYRTYSEAVEAIDEIRKCTLLVLDLILPLGRANMLLDEEYLGLALLRRIRHEFKLTIPVLVLSVIADGIDYNDLMELNAHPLSKPVYLDELRAEVQELLR